MSEVLAVFGYALGTALATGLGALPFALVPLVSARAVAHANAIAAGLMLGASFGLVAEGTAHGTAPTLIGAAFGVLFILATQRWLNARDVVFGAEHGPRARQALLIVIVMTVHSFAEGIAVGVAFGGGMALAVAITVAIAVHNVPEGLAISAVLRSRGSSIVRCAAWSVFSSLPQPVMAVPAFLLVEAFQVALPYGVGFAAGAMAFMVFEELLPGALTIARRPTVAVLVTCTMIGMVLFQRAL
ncbi:MAG TPA: ZIP family metal transporter [Gemmatimonadales bacterium]|nr:ZIP family metal transporter [Gemmatimonadales bacterium]